VAARLNNTLYVVPTPIGNLEDITLRAIRVLSDVDLIAAEDTRHSRNLLVHLDISTRVVSYHQHAKITGIGRVLRALETGDVALISDAGTPTISDPGFELIRAAIDAGHKVEVLPGATAVTTAVALAAIPAPGFLFLGFLPRASKDAVRIFEVVRLLPYSLVLFESPLRLRKSLSTMLRMLGNRQVLAARELTKIHEEAIRTDLEGLIVRIGDERQRGEWTIVVAPAKEIDVRPTDDEIAHALEVLQQTGETGRDAVRVVSESLGVARADVYRIWLRTGA
jgi:16S rRNA (cytidine1402-2'-O)-methyltransferase